MGSTSTVSQSKPRRCVRLRAGTRRDQFRAVVAWSLAVFALPLLDLAVLVHPTAVDVEVNWRD